MVGASAFCPLSASVSRAKLPWYAVSVSLLGCPKEAWPPWMCWTRMSRHTASRQFAPPRSATMPDLARDLVPAARVGIAIEYRVPHWLLRAPHLFRHILCCKLRPERESYRRSWRLASATWLTPIWQGHPSKLSTHSAPCAPSARATIMPCVMLRCLGRRTARAWTRPQPGGQSRRCAASSRR